MDVFMTQFLNTEIVIILLLLVISTVALIVRGLQIPYTVALVVTGLLLSLQSTLKFQLTPDLILALFVPPLIFEAAFHLNFSELRNNLTSILVFAVPGVILTTLIVGGILILTGLLPVPVAMLFGALISATDPLAVIATFRKLGAPSQLSVLVEGESLLNDGTAIVMYNLMLAFVLTGQFNLLHSSLDFLRVSLGGIMVGLLLGWMVSQVIARVDDYLIETTFTTILAYGAYLAAEQFHFSGVLAVVAAGLVNGNLGSRGMSPTTRIVLSNFWEYLAFLVNSIVFLLIGLQVNYQDLGSNWEYILLAITAVLVSRFSVVYAFGWILNRISQEKIPMRWQHIMSWSGLRGAISLALALSLPISLGDQGNKIQVMTFGIVLFTLLIQSTTMRPVLHFLKIVTQSRAQIEYETHLARLSSLQYAGRRLDRFHTEGRYSGVAWEKLQQYITNQAQSLMVHIGGLVQSEPELEAKELETGWRELLRSQRSHLISLRRDGVITDEVFDTLTTEIDADLTEGSPMFPEGPSNAVFTEVTIRENSWAVGKTLAELELPNHAVLVSIRRGTVTLIPRGLTQLQAGDAVSILCEREYIQDVRKTLTKAETSL